MPASPRERVVAALASAAVLLGLATALVIGLAPPAVVPRLAGALVAVLIAPRAMPPKPPPPPPPRPVATPRPQGGAAPRALATALPPAAPPPAPPVVIVPPPLPVATGPGTMASASGRQDGGNGGVGSGAGAGAGAGEGRGTGDSPADQPAVPARQIHGHLSPGDVPDGVLPPGGSAAVTVRYVVGPNGGVSGCTVTAASGTPRVDAIPCPLIERRFRFRPARDAHGRAVPETIVETHTWFEPERRGRRGSPGAASPPPAPAAYAP